MALKKCKKECILALNILVQGFCLLKIKLSQFANRFHLKIEFFVQFILLIIFSLHFYNLRRDAPAKHLITVAKFYTNFLLKKSLY